MELGGFDAQKGYFDGPYLHTTMARTDSDWALRRFLEEHRRHNVGFASDYEMDNVRLGGYTRVQPTDLFCMTFVPDPVVVYDFKGFSRRFQKVLFIVDVYDWAWDIASRGLLNFLPEVDGHIVDTKDFLEMDFRPKDWDMVLVYPWFSEIVVKRLDPNNTIICVAGGEQLTELKRRFELNCGRFSVYGANTTSIRDALKKRYPKKHIILLSHGVDTEKFKPDPVPHDEFTVGWVGAIGRNSKRVGLAKKICTELGMKLKIAGRGVKGLYIPHDEMPEFYNSVDVLFITSKYEAHPLIAYEAMACGLPVISGNVGDLWGIIENGENGFRFDACDQARGFRSALKLLRGDEALRKSMGEKARAAILQRWQWESIVEQYKGIPETIRTFQPITQKKIPHHKHVPQPISAKEYREARERDLREGCLVTFALPVVSRVDVTKTVVESIMIHANFPHIFKAIVHPDLIDLRKWLEERGIIVESSFYFPIVRAKDAMTKFCDTKYLFMFDNDFRPNTPLKPMLDFMEEHPDVGVCATAIVGTEHHSLLHYGADFVITQSRTLVSIPRQEVLPFNYTGYAHHAATLFRMKMFDDVAYDTKYPGQGHEHEDLFLQVLETDWKVVSYNACTSTPIHDFGERPYRLLRARDTRKSFRYFKEKWNIKSKGRRLDEDPVPD